MMGSAWINQDLHGWITSKCVHWKPPLESCSWTRGRETYQRKESISLKKQKEVLKRKEFVWKMAWPWNSERALATGRQLVFAGNEETQKLGIWPHKAGQSALHSQIPVKDGKWASAHCCVHQQDSGTLPGAVGHELLVEGYNDLGASHFIPDGLYIWVIDIWIWSPCGQMMRINIFSWLGSVLVDPCSNSIYRRLGN